MACEVHPRVPDAQVANNPDEEIAAADTSANAEVLLRRCWVAESVVAGNDMEVDKNLPRRPIESHGDVVPFVIRQAVVTTCTGTMRHANVNITVLPATAFEARLRTADRHIHTAKRVQDAV